MSSDDYCCGDEELDSAILSQLDAIEAAHSNPSFALNSGDPPSVSQASSTSGRATQPLSPRSSPHSNLALIPELLSKPPAYSKATSVEVVDSDTDDSYDEVFHDIDAAELERLDKDVEDAYKQGSERHCLNVASGSGTIRQLTLFGDTLPVCTPRSQRPSQRAGQRSPRSPRNPFGQKARKTKKWDHTVFAKSGWKLGKSAGEKKKPIAVEFDGEEQSPEEFEQFPPPVARKYSFASPPSRTKLTPDMLAVQTWIFPTNQPKRDYQFNIIRASLFENALVAVPTGLGKTFIAGVVMLNYYRWFPEGKVVFVAPTKPLVAQQIEACHKTCGIPGGDAAELTGQNTKANRAKAWAEKRVFYMTPQTLMNDLKTENCDPTDIVLLVVDEAHKATGDYAYAQVVRYLMATNAHFRILALTATPGSKAEAVQAIIDSLHISHIEIRDENSIDLRVYMQPKEISTHTIKMNEDIARVRDKLAKVMDQTAKRLASSGLLPNFNPVTLHPYRCSALMRQYTQDGTSRKFPWLYSTLKKLGSLARAMGYLLECSTPMCHQTLQELSLDEKAKKVSNNFGADPLFQDLIKELEHQHNVGFTLHPKMEALQNLAVDYFAQAAADAEEVAPRARHFDDELQNKGDSTKMMVFTNFRASVDEIVDVLNQHRPMIRATPFVGQGTDKSGKRGIAQKEQLEVIHKFKDGVYNVLVSTSIGEEGLDIGEVDMIICYDAQKTPIRMLQRIGRTGRKRAGKVAVLLSENREEANWQKAKSDYESVQTSIVRGESLELFGDVDRLLPDNVKPKCLEMRMAIEEYTREIKTPRSQILPKSNKRKRNDDVHRNIPEGATTGFISSSKLIRKGAKKQKPATKDYDLNEIEDDEDDLAIQAGIRGFPVQAKLTGKGKSKGSSKQVTKKAAASASRRKKLAPVTSPQTSTVTTQVSRMSANDSSSMEIEKGVEFSSPARRLTHSISTNQPSPGAGVGSAHHTPPFSKPESPHSWLLNSDSDREILGNASPSPNFMHGSKESHTFRRSPLSHVPIEESGDDVRTPPLPSHATMLPGTSSELSFAIRPPGIRRKRKQIEPSSPSPTRKILAPDCSPPAPSPSRPVARKAPRHRNSISPGILLDIEAEVSGDDFSSGNSYIEVESESDTRFVQELPATQASPSYDQTAAYRDSLFTQAQTSGGPCFATKLIRRGPFGVDRQPSGANVSSSPAKNESSDQYSMDSFVVPDDDDVQ